MSEFENDPYIQKLRALKPKFKDMNIARLRVFGSRARGDAGPDSDLDLLVDFIEPVGLMKYAGLKIELEDYLNIRVDLLREYCLHDKIRQRALKDVIDV